MFLLVLGLAWVVQLLGANTVLALVIAAVLALLGGYIYISIATSPRLIRKRLLAKYGQERLVDDIMAHRLWIGETEGQLLDIFGSPPGRDI
jgi:hypothetical protein